VPILVDSQLDLNSLPPLNLVFPSLSSDLTANAGNNGKIYVNSTSGRLRYHKNATTIVNLDIDGVINDASIAAGAGIQLSKLAVDPLARANHTGTQLAATISDLAAVVQAYRLDQFAAPTAAVGGNAQRATNWADPTSAQDLATKNYTDNAISTAITGQDWKASVRVAATANIASLSGTQTIDGVALSAGDRVLAKNQTTASQNGIWVVAAGAWSRATDADTSAEVTNGMTVPVEGGGTANGGTVWILTTANPITVGTTSLAFSQIGAAGSAYSAGTGITLTGNTFSLTIPVVVSSGGTGSTTASGARTNLGVAQKPVVVAQSSALTAGVEATFAHGTGADGIPEARNATTKARVMIALRSDSTNIYVTSDVAVTSGTLEFVYIPVA
jgi:hypothetical protein